MDESLMKRDIVVVVATLLLGCSLSITTLNTNASYPKPFFTIDILAPNTFETRNEWITMIVEELPKIGIAVDTFDHTGWAQIFSRAYNYPGPYPIPPYDEGGYDILFIGESMLWGLDWEPKGLYDSSGFIPTGDNIYQYNNSVMNQAIEDYCTAYAIADRIELAHQIQEILYEDLPQITIYYSQVVYSYAKNFTGWDGALWSSDFQPMVEWEIPTKTNFTYACPVNFTSFHPTAFFSEYDGQWLHQIYNGLAERDTAYGRGFGPWLCESYTSTDGLTYNVVLKDDIIWADGTPITTDDVNYTYHLAWSSSLWGGATFHSPVESITIISDTEIQITFYNGLQTFLDYLLGTYLLPKHIWGNISAYNQRAQAENWAINNPAKLFGAGPYKLANYDSTNQIIHLVRNEYFDDWSGVTPYFEDVYFVYYDNKETALAALAVGEVDMVDAQFGMQINEIETIDKAAYELVDIPSYQEMALNMEHPWIGTGENCPIAGWESAKHIRKAINHLIPRNIIIDEVLNGVGAPGIIGCPSAAAGFNEELEPYEYSIAHAKEHMIAAGFTYETSIIGANYIVVISLFSSTFIAITILCKKKKNLI